MARLRSAPVAPPSPQKPQSKRQALKEKTNTLRAMAPVYEDDGNTENLVKPVKARRGRPKKSMQQEDELVMAGGLGRSESEAARSEAPMTTDELAKSDGPPPPTAKANRRPPRMTRKVVQSEAQSKVLEGLKKRMEATARKGVGRKDALAAATESTVISSDQFPTRPTAARKSTSTAHERSEYSLSPSPPPPGKLSSVKRSSLAHSGTPAVESSILALKNFKRRPRQPSMLQMVQQRTVSARPSAVNLAASEDPSVYDMEAVEDDDVEGEDDEDDFAPDAEGTPLHVSKTKRRSSASVRKKQPAKPAAPVEAKAAAPTKKRKSDEADRSSSALEALRTKRQKSDAPGPVLDDEHLPTFERSTSARRTSSSDRQATPQQQITSDVQVINSSPSSTPPTEPSSSAGRDRTAINEDDYAVPSTEKEHAVLRPITPSHFDDHLEHDAPNGTMAEPASSSPLPEGPLDAPEQDEIFAEPVTQVTQQSPVREREKPNKKKKASKPVSTATLQSLLPKRRERPKPRRRKTEYDFTSDEEDGGIDALDASHLEDDEDELGGRLRRQTKVTPAKGKKGTVAKANSKTAQAHKSTATVPALARTKTPVATQGAAKKPNKTYGRAAPTSANKENEDAGDSSEPEEEGDATDMPVEVSTHEAVAGSKELEVAKRKFAEVDEWDMEFESLSAGEEGRSSSQTWR